MSMSYVREIHPEDYLLDIQVQKIKNIPIFCHPLEYMRNIFFQQVVRTEFFFFFFKGSLRGRLVKGLM